MSERGRRTSYNGSFDRYLPEKCATATLKMNLAEALTVYCGMFHGPFFNIEVTSISICNDNDKEIRNCIGGSAGAFSMDARKRIPTRQSK
ncbi:hypothetical protein [Bifidobacterium pseudolongum]|uniref:hypothetical protein n=1 Tax=Bifidobacterium pseudolongum TaxID=1694 RepID=UPI0022E21A34|nr:hypothetical protein [Bifidobacterium pseudolongum]